MSSKIKGICIKPYIDEDSLEEFTLGEITSDEIIFYQLGEEGDIIDGMYNKEYWKAK